MNFLFTYTKSNIRANKLRALLLMACVGFAALLFFLSLAFPVYLGNYQENVMRSYFGTSDIYMEATTSALGNKADIPTHVQDNFEYMYTFIALPGSSMYSNATGKNELATFIAGFIEDVQDFNPVKVIKGNVDDFSGRAAIITQSAAELFGRSVGDKFRVYVPNLIETQFTVVAIVANDGLLSTDNEKSGPIVLLAKDGVSEYIRKTITGGSSLTDAQVNNFFNMSVIKLKDGVNIRGMAGTLAEQFPTFKVEETVNNEALNSTINYLKTPFVACIYLVCAFCALIIYLTCKLTFAERVRQFATLKSMGATSKGLFYSLLLESAFYGLIGSIFAIVFSVAQVYLFPIIFPSMTYITPVPFWYYILTVVFGIGLAVGSSFFEALKSVKKSIKETMTKQEKFQTQNKAVSIVALASFAVFAVVMMCTLGIKTKALAIPIFLITLIAIIVALPLIISLIFWIYKKIFRKQSFEHLYMRKTLPSKNLSVANRLLFFGTFLVLLFSVLISSLSRLSVVGQQAPFNLQITQAGASNIRPEDLDAINSLEEIDLAYVGTKLSKINILERTYILNSLYALNIEDIDRLYGNKVTNYQQIRSKIIDGSGILLNKYLRDAKGFKIGDTFTLIHGNPDEEHFVFEVAGFIEDDYYEVGEYAIAILDSLSSAQNIDIFNSVFVNVNPAFEIDEAIAAIRALPFISAEPEGNNDDEVSIVFLTFINMEKQSEIFLAQVKTPLSILRGYSFLVLVLSMLCVFVGYVLYLKEASEYHKTMFALGMSANRFKSLIIRQTIFTSICTLLSALVMSMLLFFQFENVFNALGTSFVLQINWLDVGLFTLGIFLGSLILAILLGQHFKNDLTRNIKRLFG